MGVGTRPAINRIVAFVLEPRGITTRKVEK
jgi:hypothetical protein